MLSISIILRRAVPPRNGLVLLTIIVGHYEITGLNVSRWKRLLRQEDEIFLEKEDFRLKSFFELARKHHIVIRNHQAKGRAFLKLRPIDNKFWNFFAPVA